MTPFAGAAAISTLCLAGAASAEPAIDGNTSCRVVVGYLDAHDSLHAHQAFLMVKELVAQADRAAMTRGQPSALAPLSDRQVEDIYIAGIEYCRDDPQHTLGQAAHEVYDDLRDLHGQLPVPH